MATLFVDCLTRATLVAGGTAVVLWAMRVRSAATRHAAWTAVVIAMLLLPLWSVAGLRLPVRILRPVSPAITTTTDASADSSPITSEPNEGPLVSDPVATPTRRFGTFDILLVAYLLVAGVLLARLATGTVLALRLRRGAVVESGIATSARCATPITIGWLKPMAVLPSVWPRWPENQLRAVLTHEAEHVRRRDPLVQWLALLNRAVFWFHPVAWWLERRLSALAEEACDAAVLAAGYSAEDYSRYLLELARSVAGHRHRVHIGMPDTVGVEMIGQGLAGRLRHILAGGPTPRVSRTRVVCTFACCAVTSIMLAAGTLTPRTVVSPQTRFEVVSIKPCKGDELPPGARGAGPGGPSPSIGRLHMECVPLVGANGVIRRAYGTFENGVRNAYLHPTAIPVEGGPAWVKTDRYTIDAKAEGTPSVEMMLGPMMQRVLEDRFQLKIRRETREIPVYVLTQAKGGSKLKPFDGRCKPVDFTKGNIPAQLEAEGACPVAIRDTRVDAPGQTIADFNTFVLTLLDRPVIDRTGLTGRFDIHLNFTPDDPASDVTATIAAAVQQQLGLKLTPAKGPGEYLIIDHAERPSSDLESTAAPRAEAPAPQAAPSGQFDVASIKPCAAEAVPPGGRSGGGNGSFSTGRAYLTCFVVKNLVSTAYINNRGSRTDPAKDAADPLYNWPGLLGRDVAGGPEQIRGGPAWVYSDKYTIEATAPGLDPSDGRSPDRKTMLGPMLRALLEDRFKLKLHEQYEEAPMWALTVAKSGLKIKPMQEGDCTQGWPNGPIPLSKAASLGVKPTCGTVNGGPDGPNWRWEHGGQDLAVVASMLSSDLGAKVLDRTGVTEKFNIMWEYGPDENTPGAVRWMAQFAPGGPPPTAANVFTALEQQLGLKLERTKGTRGYLVIDHIERPNPDLPSAQPPRRATGPGGG